jgi:hypothetical protein
MVVLMVGSMDASMAVLTGLILAVVTAGKMVYLKVV